LSIEITPPFDKWNQESDAFIAVFKAFDDKGNKCKGDKFFIEYGLTYDGTMPNLGALTKLDSDASGLIILTITMPCVISLYGSYAHDVYDSNKGMIRQELGINYQITFQPIIIGFTAFYSGPPVPITDNLDFMELTVTAHMSDGSKIIDGIDDCIINQIDIDTIGENIRTVTYNDLSLGVVWVAEFIVIGIPKLLFIQSRYTSYKRIIGDRILPSEVSVTGTYLTELDKQEEVKLTEDQWYFADIPIITESNNGIITIGYNGCTSTITVLYETTTFLQLNVWYEGDKIEVGSSYSPENLAIYLVYPEEPDKIRITYKECTISSYEVTKEGWNWFTATYNYELKKVKQWFPVLGIVSKQYINLDFKVLYIDEITKQETDYTDTFKLAMTIQDTLFISWEIFLAKVNELALYGLYILTAPRGKGLSNQHDTDWEVLCIDDTTLKASIKHFYKEEDNG